jgi:hypothetical protein
MLMNLGLKMPQTLVVRVENTKGTGDAANHLSLGGVADWTNLWELGDEQGEVEI